MSQQSLILKPSLKLKGKTDLSQPESDVPVFFQAIGIITGSVQFNEERKASVKVAGVEYPLFYAANHRQVFVALSKEIKNTGNHEFRLLVYPRAIHFPQRETPHSIAFQAIAFSPLNQKFKDNCGLGDFEFKLSGLWQFIPVCQLPCISVFKNFSPERLAYIKEASSQERVRFMKASHLPVVWHNSAARPFRFNPKLEKDKQGQAVFTGIKARFIPARNVFEFQQLLINPTAPPNFLKAGKKDKSEALRQKKANG